MPRATRSAGPREQQGAVGRLGDVHRAAGHVHLPGRLPRLDGTVASASGPGHRAGTRAARQRLPHAALVHAHRDVVRAAVDDELDVHAVGEHVGRGHVGGVGQVAGVVELVDEHDRVRVRDEDAGGRPRCVRRPTRAEAPWHAASSPVPMSIVMVRSRVDGHAAQSAAGGDDDVVVGHQAGRVEVAHEHAGAVAAHLGERAVGVAVVHEELGDGGELLEPGHVLGAHDAQDAVAADAHVPVAEPAHLLGREVEVAVDVGDDDEVVAGAVALDERHLVESRHAASLTSVGRGPRTRVRVARRSRGRAATRPAAACVRLWSVSRSSSARSRPSRTSARASPASSAASRPCTPSCTNCVVPVWLRATTGSPADRPSRAARPNDSLTDGCRYTSDSAKTSPDARRRRGGR